jgi:adenylate kinase family enzyme
MKRVAVVGSSGSGKTTVASAIAAALSIPHLELDSVYHQPKWRELPSDVFRDAVRSFADGDAWIIDGNYTIHGIADIVWPQADTIVWLDLSRSQTMRRIVPRTLRRLARREALWNGNRERWTKLVDPRPEENVILWAWARHPTVRRDYADRFAAAQSSHLTLIRLRTPAEIDEFVRSIGE